MADVPGSNQPIILGLPGADDAKDAMDAIRDSKPTWAKQRGEMEDAFKFYSGDQWDSADKAALKDEDRIAVVFNFCKKYIDQIIGSEIHNRQDTRFVPRNLDPQNLPQITSLGELETSAYNYVMDRCNGEEEVSAAFLDMIRGGMGFTEVFVDRNLEKDVRILVRKINPLEMMWDARATMQNLEDARWIARARFIPLEEAKEMFPDKELELRYLAENAAGFGIEHTPEIVENITPIRYVPDGQKVSPGETSGKKGMVPIIQYQWWTIETVYRIHDPEDDQVHEFSEDEYKKLKKRSEELGSPLQAEDYQRRVYKEIFITGGEIPLTEAEDLPVQAGGFTYKAMTGWFDLAEKVYRGLLYQMMDPQRYVNKWLSQTVYIISSNPKGGLMAEATAFKDPSQVETTWAKPNGIILLEKDALKDGRVQVKPISPLPEASYRMMQFSVEALTGVTGINPEMLGQNDVDLPALTMRQRMVQGMQINAVYFNALTRYRRNQARTVLEFIREFMSDQTLLRVGGPFNAKLLPFMKQNVSPEYDVVIDEAVRSPNAKAEVWAALQPVLPVMVRQGLIIPEVIDLIPGLPESLGAKFKERMEQAAQQGAMGGKQGRGAAGKQPDPMESQAKMMKAQADMKLSEAKREEALARARAIDQQSRVKAMATMGDLAVKHHKAQRDTQVAHAKAMREAQAHQVKMIQDSLKSPVEMPKLRAKVNPTGE